LIDAYIGVDFSIVYKVTLQFVPRPGNKALEGNAQFYCKVPDSGIDQTIGRKDQSRDFMITPDALTAAPG